MPRGVTDLGPNPAIPVASPGPPYISRLVRRVGVLTAEVGFFSLFLALRFKFGFRFSDFTHYL